MRIAWEWRKVRRSFRKSEQQELLQKLEASNRTIERLVNNSNQEVVARSKVRPDSSLAYLESVHEEAGQVFDILEQGWKCSCAVPHDVHLELEQREAVQQFPLFKTLLYVQPLSTHAQPQNNIRHEAHIRLEKMKALVHCATELPPKKLRRAVKFSALPDDCVATGPVQSKCLLCQSQFGNTVLNLEFQGLGCVFS